MKKEMNKIIISNVIVSILKVLVSFLCRSYALLESALYDLEQVITLLFSKLSKDVNSKFKGLITALINFGIILGSIGFVYLSFICDIKKPSLFLILFILIFVMIKYAINVIITNKNYARKQGVIGISTYNSTLDYYNYGIILLSMITGKISKWVDVLKYSDRVATILLALLVIVKAIKNIIRSFKAMGGNTIIISDQYKEEITKRNEIKTLDNINIKYFGGYSYVTSDVAVSEGISMIDINSFMVTMGDYLIKIADVGIINMTNTTRKTKTIKRVKANAGNSRSRNSKTSTKKKNTKKTNKKR